MMQYEEIPKLTKEKFEIQTQNASEEELCLLLLGIYALDDWQWVQDTYLKYLTHQDEWIVKAAITGIGHLARVHGGIEKEKVLSSLNKLAQSNPELAGKIEDTISDINIFT